MLDFSTHNYHSDYVEYYQQQCDIIKEQVHLLHDEMYDLYILLEKEYEWLNYYDINLYNIISLQDKGISINQGKFAIERQLFISRYNHLLFIIKNIQHLSKLLDKFTLYAKIPYIIFKIIIYAINFEITVRLLKGSSFVYPVLGTVFISRVTYNSNMPDWGESLKYRQLLEERGFTIKDKDNINGKAWLVDNGLSRDYFTLLTWNKSTCKLHNKEPYRLIPCTFGNIYSKSLDRIFSIDELLQNTRTGLFDKIIHLYRYYYQYTIDTFPFKLHTKHKTNI